MASLQCRRIPHCFSQASRSFSTTAIALRQPTTKPESLLPADAIPVPPYPYGSARWYKQQNMGLYGGQTLQHGHNVSEKNKIKTLTRWKPNVQRKWLYSPALGRSIRTRVTARVLRTIDKVGGLDAYLLGGGAARAKELGIWGWRLRWAVLNAESTKSRIPHDPELRSMLGLDEEAVMNPPQPEPEAVVHDEIVGPPPIPEVEARMQSDAEPGLSEQEMVRHLREEHMDEQPGPPPAGPMGLAGRARQLFSNPFKR